MIMRHVLIVAGSILLGASPAWAVQNGVADIYSAPFAGEVAATVGTVIPLPAGSTIPPWRALKANCTAGGTITFTYQDGTPGQWIVAVGSQTIPINITVVSASTATCTYAVLK